MEKLDKNTSERILTYMRNDVDSYSYYSYEGDKIILSAVRMLACVYDYSDVIAIINQIIDFKIYHNYFINIPQLTSIMESDKYKTFFKGIGDYCNLEKAGIIRGFPKTPFIRKNLSETDKMRIEAIDRINDWRLAYAMRALNNIKISEYHITMKNLVELFVDLYDNNMIDSMMILGDCLSDSLANNTKISRKAMKLKWWVEMKDYPEEFIKQAILTDRIGVNYNDYIKTANEIMAKFRTRKISFYYWAKLFKMNTDSYDYHTQEYKTTISSCSDAWITRNMPRITVINESIMNYIENKPVSKKHDYNSFYRIPYISSMIVRPPVANTMNYKTLATDDNMKHYVHVFKNANTSCRIAAWEWMLTEASALSSSLRLMYDEEASKDFPSSSYDVNDNEMLKALYDYIDNGIIPDSYCGVEITSLMKQLMRTVAEHDYSNDDNDDYYKIQNLIKTMFNTDNVNIFEKQILELFM